MIHKSHTFIIHLTVYTALNTERKRLLIFIFINLQLSLWTVASHFFESQPIDLHPCNILYKLMQQEQAVSHTDTGPQQDHYTQFKTHVHIEDYTAFSHVRNFTILSISYWSWWLKLSIWMSGWTNSWPDSKQTHCRHNNSQMSITHLTCRPWVDANEGTHH